MFRFRRVNAGLKTSYHYYIIIVVVVIVAVLLIHINNVQFKVSLL